VTFVTAVACWRVWREHQVHLDELQTGGQIPRPLDLLGVGDPCRIVEVVRDSWDRAQRLLPCLPLCQEEGFDVHCRLSVTHLRLTETVGQGVGTQRRGRRIQTELGVEQVIWTAAIVSHREMVPAAIKLFNSNECEWFVMFRVFAAIADQRFKCNACIRDRFF
jgi:hypothetical protein